MLNTLGRLTSFLFIFTACSPAQPEIELGCDIDSAFNYTIKWDVYPSIDGIVKVYAASSPNNFTIDTEPVATANISDGNLKLVSNNIMGRQYFLLTFNDKYSQVVATRAPRMSDVQNFRDIGGYKTGCGNKTIRWGMIYRSGSLDNLDKISTRRFQGMKINTLIDFRSVAEFEKPSPDLHLQNVFNLPITLHDVDTVSNKLKSNQFMRGDAIVYMQDVYGRVMREATPALRSMFNQLLVEDNYPIVISCVLGKDFTGIAAGLIMAALGVPDETIIEDYTLSNNYINIKSVTPSLDMRTPETQEAVTTMLSANEKYLLYAINVVNQEYGGVDSYLVNQLGMTPEKRRKLKEILLK